MKILLCGRRKEKEQIAMVADGLKKLGHKVNSGSLSLENKQSPPFEPTNEFRELKAINMRKHFREIEKCDAVLVCNFWGYIGMNTFAEIMSAWYLGKTIYFLEGYDVVSSFGEELYAVEPIVLDCDLSKIGGKIITK